MKYFICLGLLAIFSCNSKQEPIESASINIDSFEYFEFSLNDYNYSLGYSIKYQIKNDSLSIIFVGELEGEKDTVLFSKPIKDLSRLNDIQSSINMDSLDRWYRNPCISDGDVKIFRIIKGNKHRKVQVDNYYHPQIGDIVYEINNLIPKDYKIHYDSTDLINSLKKCGSLMITKIDEETVEIEVGDMENSIREEQELKKRK